MTPEERKKLDEHKARRRIAAQAFIRVSNLADNLLDVGALVAWRAGCDADQILRHVPPLMFPPGYVPTDLPPPSFWCLRRNFRIVGALSAVKGGLL